MPRTIILTDIHGCNQTLQALLHSLEPQSDDHLCFLGDYIDRGPDSKGVIDTIWRLQEQVGKVTCLIGNHEQKMLDIYHGDTEGQTNWLYWGGEQTLDSFGAQYVKDIPEKYLSFLDGLPVYAVVKEAILVHAGLDFHLDDPFTGEWAMKWIRDWYPDINYEWLDDRIVIHGHTPVHWNAPQAHVDRLEENRYLNLDTGCVYDRPGFGMLTAFHLEERKIYQQKRMEKGRL